MSLCPGESVPSEPAAGGGIPQELAGDLARAGAAGSGRRGHLGRHPQRPAEDAQAGQSRQPRGLL